MTGDGVPPAGVPEQAAAGVPAAGPPPTPSQTAGPFLAIGLAPLARGELVPDGTPGAVAVGGRVLDGRGEPVPDAAVEIWQPGEAGRIGSPAAGGGPRPAGPGAGAGAAPAAPGFGRCLTDPGGRFRFVTTVPEPVALRSGVLQAPHLDVLVFARGLTRWLRTRAYFGGEPANHADPVLAAVPADRRTTLVAVPDPEAPAGRRGFRFDIRLQGDGETVFFAG